MARSTQHTPVAFMRKQSSCPPSTIFRVISWHANLYFWAFCHSDKKKGGGQEKLVWFQCWTQTANIKRGLSHWCISVSNITPSSKALSPGYGSEQCFFLLILMRKMCPLLLGNIVESRRQWSKLLWRGPNVFEIFKVISSMLGLLTCPNMWEPLRSGESQS